jgi:hypothetical protein
MSHPTVTDIAVRPIPVDIPIEPPTLVTASEYDADHPRLPCPGSPAFRPPECGAVGDASPRSPV